MRVLLLVATLAWPATAWAQREYVEEVDPQKHTTFENVDLDAPDPAAHKRPDAGPAAAPAKTEPAHAPDAGPANAAGKAAPAKGEPAKPEPGAKPAPDKAPLDDLEQVGGVDVLETSYDAFLEKWDARAASVRRGEVARARKQLPDLDGALLDFGVQGIPGGFQATAPATALLREARKALDDGSLDEAQALVDVAEHAAPDLPSVHGAQALLRWKAGDLGGTINALADTARAALRDPLTATQLAARGLAAAGAVLVLALVLFALLAGLPALRYLSFDLLQALPKGAHGGQVLALVVLAAIAPLVVGAGPVFGALWILTLAWLYLQRGERIAVGLLAALCVAIPLGVDAGARLVAWPGSRGDREIRALFDASAEPIRRALAQKKPADLDAVEQAALALAAKREGRIPDAVARWTALMGKHPELGFVHADLGVAASLANDENTALAELGKAVAENPHEYAASFDISVLHYRASRTDKAQAAVEPVAREAPALLNAYRRTTFRQPDQHVGQNRALIDVYPRPTALLRAHLVKTPESSAVEETVARVLLRGQTGTRAAAFLAAFPLLWLLLFAARKKIAPAQPCVRCGDPASQRVDGKDVPEDTCGQCFHAFVSTRSRIDAGVKLRKEREIIRRRTRRGRIILALAVLCPGGGHVYGGAPGRGLVLFTLWSAGLSALLLCSGRLPMPRLDGLWGHTPGLAVAGLVVAVVWIASLRSAWLLAEDASGRGRR